MGGFILERGRVDGTGSHGGFFQKGDDVGASGEERTGDEGDGGGGGEINRYDEVNTYMILTQDISQKTLQASPRFPQRHHINQNDSSPRPQKAP